MNSMFDGCPNCRCSACECVASRPEVRKTLLRQEQIEHLVGTSLRIEDGYRRDWALLVCDVRVAESDSRDELYEMASALEAALCRMVRIAVDMT